MFWSQKVVVPKSTLIPAAAASSREVRPAHRHCYPTLPLAGCHKLALVRTPAPTLNHPLVSLGRQIRPRLLLSRYSQKNGLPYAPRDSGALDPQVGVVCHSVHHLDGRWKIPLQLTSLKPRSTRRRRSQSGLLGALSKSLSKMRPCTLSKVPPDQWSSADRIARILMPSLAAHRF